MSAFPDSIRWYAALVAMTVAFAPLARVLAGRMPGRGAYVAAPIGLLATVWPLWFLAGATPLPYTTTALWITVFVGGIVSWVALWRLAEIDSGWVWHLLTALALASIAFFAYIGFRGYVPNITGTEKPMDIAMMSSSARAVNMPPADPWMAREPINYYYLGYLLYGSLSRMSGVATGVGFNLALATTFSMTLTAAAGLGFGLVRKRLGFGIAVLAGGLSAFGIVLAGNLWSATEWVRDPGGVWNGPWWEGIGWNASRVVIDGETKTINEFPAFSFVLGDLHPHVMALPFTIVALTIGLALFERRDANEGRYRWSEWAVIAGAGAVIGSLYPINSWDYPTYLGAAGLALLFAYGWSRDAIIRIVVLGVASIVAWAPFWVTFVPFAGGTSTDTSGVRGIPVLSRLFTTIGGYTGDRTSAGEILGVFGMPWAIVLVALGWEVSQLGGERLRRTPRWVGGGFVVLALIALLVPFPVLLLAGLPLALAVALLLDRSERRDADRTIMATLVIAGFGLILVTEIFFVQDVFEGRLNTLFKVYYQVWTLLGIAVAIGIARIWRAWSGNQAMRLFAGTGVVLFLLFGTIYPVVSARGWIDWQGPRDWHGLDGAAFVGEDRPDDLAAIRWLQDNAEDDDIVAEAPGCSYTLNFGVPTNRVSTFTGVPAIIGWGGHERQWRGGQDDLLASIVTRQADVAALYSSPMDTALLDRYGVTLLMVGSFELDGAGTSCDITGPYAAVRQDGYPGDGWSEVFSSGDTHIFRRDESIG